MQPQSSTDTNAIFVVIQYIYFKTDDVVVYIP